MCIKLAPRAEAKLCSPKCPHQEQMARNGDKAPREAAPLAVQLSGCATVHPAVQRLLLSHAGERITWRGGESAQQSLGGIVVLLVGSWELLPLMAFVTQQQIQKVRSCALGTERVCSAGR